MKGRNRHIVIGAVALIVLTGFSYAVIDRPLALLCRNLDDRIILLFQWITELGKSTWYLIGSFLLFLFFKYYRHLTVPANRAAFLFAAIALSGLMTDVVKPIVGRLRPKLFYEAGLYGFEPFRVGYEYNSFPSGHATTIFALAAALILFFPRWRIPLLMFAVIVGASRIIIGAHYLSDVLAGVAVGTATVILLSGLARRQNFPLHGSKDAET